jgi:hypothetical protein
MHEGKHLCEDHGSIERGPSMQKGAELGPTSSRNPQWQKPEQTQQGRKRQQNQENRSAIFLSITKLKHEGQLAAARLCKTSMRAVNVSMRAIHSLICEKARFVAKS